MRQGRLRLSTALFAAGLLLAGAMHMLDRALILSIASEAAAQASALRAALSTALFVGNLAIYIGLLLWWLWSVQQRLLPSRGRTELLLAGALMLLFLLEWAVKYRLAERGSALEHVCWYAYYVPLAAIPALFLLTARSMQPTRRRGRAADRAILLCTLTLIALVVTNDLHFWMFRPISGVSQGGAWGAYDTGPLWYVFYAWVCLCILLGLGLLARSDRHQGGRRALPPALLMLLTLGVMYVTDAYLGRRHIPTPYSFPEAFIIGMLGIFESCIRSRLIPFNENYDGFFAQLDLPAEITDADLAPVCATRRPVRATAEQRRACLSAPVPLDADTRLFGGALRGGYVFWTGDEGTLRRLNEALSDAAEVLETENELLRYENEQKEQRARVDARNRVYARAAREVYGTQKRIAALLEGLDPAEPDYRDSLARVLLLNAYVKRKTNFVLLSSERETVSAEELVLALEESARFLSFCGLSVSIESTARRELPVAEAEALYDSFQALSEALLGRTAALMAFLRDGALRLMADGALPDALPETPAAVEAETEGGQLYLTLTARKEAAV